MPETTRSLQDVLPRRTVAIVGLGLLGSSLAMALREKAPGIRVLACARRQASIDQALAGGYVQQGDPRPDHILPRADLTVVCLPVSTTIDFLRDHAGEWSTGSVVTEVASIKRDVVENVTGPLARAGVHFLGSHPMAGSERSGQDAAAPHLYAGASVFVTPGPTTAAHAVEAVNRLWHTVGARTVEVDPTRHDRIVSRTSHVLHLVSAAAPAVLLDDELAIEGTAGGFRDFTRIAASSPDMWADICRHNRDAVIEAFDDILAEQNRLRQLVEDCDWDGLRERLAAAADARSSWYDQWDARRKRP